MLYVLTIVLCVAIALVVVGAIVVGAVDALSQPPGAVFRMPWKASGSTSWIPYEENRHTNAGDVFDVATPGAAGGEEGEP